MQLFKNAWPTPEEERANAWKSMSLLVQCVFFFLTAIAITAAAILLPGWFVMIACIAAAEFLIRSYRFWRTGVESALWIGGPYAFIFSLPHSGKPEALLVLAAGAAIAGWRVRNALFGTLALCLIVAYLAVTHRPALLFALVISLVALFAVTRAWRRASTELLFQMLLIVMPIAGYVSVYQSASRFSWAFAALAIVFAFVGIRWRLRVPLVACAIAIAIAVIDARIPLSLEVQLIAGGTVALIVAATLTRILRRRTTGFVLDTMQTSDVESILTGVAPALLPVHPAATSPQVNPQGGEFGGAGASGNF